MCRTAFADSAGAHHLFEPIETSRGEHEVCALRRELTRELSADAR
jgi:hypothetical protein